MTVWFVFESRPVHVAIDLPNPPRVRQVWSFYMPTLPWRVSTIVSTFDDQSLLARPLLLPGVSCYAPDARRLKEALARRMGDVMRQLPPGDLFHYLLAEAPEVRSLTIELAPLHNDLLRRHPLSLALQYAVWRQPPDALIAYVPALDIAVLAENEQRLAQLLEPQVRATLSRSRATGSLRALAEIARYAELHVRPLRLKLVLPTLKEAADERQQDAAKQASPLKEIATNLTAEPSSPIYERDAEVARLAELVTRRTPRSVLLVGRSGVGKTALVGELARRRNALGLGTTALWSTSGSRIVAGMTGFGMWQERCEKLVREAHLAKAIMHLGNLIELIEVGKGGGNTQGVAALLRPHLDRGTFLALVECTPEQLAVVEREDPQLLETFTLLEVPPPTPAATQEILRATLFDRRSAPRMTDDALAVLDRLHRRYATYSASPGRPLRFLRNLLEERRGPAQSEITTQDVTAAFSRETGLPRFMLDDTVPLDLERMRCWFAQRVIGQSEAVAQVVEVLSAVKAGLARDGKPIASLLFIGPTGVGKTEMAKSLAEFLYQDRSRMIRFDMSEFSHPPKCSIVWTASRRSPLCSATPSPALRVARWSRSRHATGCAFAASNWR